MVLIKFTSIMHKWKVSNKLRSVRKNESHLGTNIYGIYITNQIIISM